MRIKCSVCKVNGGEQHRPDCQRSGVVTSESDYGDLPVKQREPLYEPEYEIDHDVMFALRDERLYQNLKWGTLKEHPHEVGGWLTIMRKLLTDAEAAWASSKGDRAALDEIRKVVATGIACMEQHGAVHRSELAFIALRGTGK